MSSHRVEALQLYRLYTENTAVPSRRVTLKLCQHRLEEDPASVILKFFQDLLRLRNTFLHYL